MNNTKPFTLDQQKYIQEGALEANRLKEIVEAGLRVKTATVEVKRHTYIFSPPGAGKTYTVASTAKANGIEMIDFRGGSSIPGLIQKLASAKVRIGDTNEIIVWIDDCDTLFMGEENLNVMKSALDPDTNMLKWEKALHGMIQGYINSPNENIKSIGLAMKQFQVQGSPGVSIPTDNMRFIITSNKDLCPPSQTIVPGKRPNNRLMHEGALRRRVNYKEFILEDKVWWGWLASILLSPDCDLGVGLDLDLSEKHILLDFMWLNWKRMADTSMSAVKDLTATMKNHPSDYPTRWEMELKNEAYK